MKRVGWWNLTVYPDHKFNKQTVLDIDSFCGWETLMWLVKAAQLTEYRVNQVDYLRRRDQALISALFECGGRVKETLLLQTSNFEFQPNKILVKDAVVLKRFEKVKSWIEKVKELPLAPSRAKLYKWNEKHRCWERNRWETRPKIEKRKPFTIWLTEPLAPVLLLWIKQSEGYLFPPGRQSKQPHLEESRAYTIVRKVEENFNRLVDEGTINLPKVRLYNHWFRSMRASQLCKEYKYREFELKRYFAWIDSKMPFHYAHLGVEELEEEWKETEDMKKARQIPINLS